MDAHTFFETARLRVRPFTVGDLEAFVAYRADADVERYQSWSDYTVEDGRALIEAMQGLRPGGAAPGQWLQLALEETAGGQLVGDLALKIDVDEPREAEVGFSLAPAHQGKGYATEALRGLLGHAFETLELHRVVAVTDALNTPAAALLQRVGMRQEAHFHENVFVKGSWGSELLFAMLEREWPAAGG
jgi:ribosomal-protein-alanine N-acetyltransferase